MNQAQRGWSNASAHSMVMRAVSAVVVMGVALSCIRHRVVPRGGVISGKVTYVESKPVAGAQVTAGGLATTTGTSGDFIIRGLPPGLISIAIARDSSIGIQLPPVTIRLGESIYVAAMMARPVTPRPIPQGIIIHEIKPGRHPLVVINDTIVARGDTIPDLSQLRIRRIETLLGSAAASLYGRLAVGGVIIISARNSR